MPFNAPVSVRYGARTLCDRRASDTGAEAQLGPFARLLLLRADGRLHLRSRGGIPLLAYLRCAKSGRLIPAQKGVADVATAQQPDDLTALHHDESLDVLELKQCGTLE